MIIRNCFLVLLILVASAKASIITTSASNARLETLNPTSRDTLIIASGHTVVIDNNWHAGDNDTTVLGIYIREGGTLQWTGGARANVGAIYIGGKGGGYPWSTNNGGRMIMSAGDTLGLSNFNTFGSYDIFVIGSQASIEITGTQQSRAVIMPLGNANANIFATGSADLQIQYMECSIQGNSANAPGWLMQDMDGGFISGSIFQQSGIRFTNVNYFVIRDCEFYTNRYRYDCIRMYGGCKQDSVIGSYFEIDNMNQSTVGPHGIDLANLTVHGGQLPDSVYLGHNRITSINNNLSVDANGSGNVGILMLGRYCKADSNVIDSMKFGMVLLNRAYGHIAQFNNISHCGHEEMLVYADSNCTIQGNLLYGNIYRCGLQFYSDYNTKGHKALYNTIISKRTGQTEWAFGLQLGRPNLVNSGQTVYWDDFTIVGNIFIGYLAGQSLNVMDRIEVNLTDFKNNAFYGADQNIYNPSLFHIDASHSYNIVDSNLIDQVSYGFVDSVGFDFRLADGSPMINAGDSAYWVEVFEPLDRSFAPGNIGCFQDLPSEPAPDSVAPAPIMDLGIFLNFYWYHNQVIDSNSTAYALFKE